MNDVPTYSGLASESSGLIFDQPLFRGWQAVDVFQHRAADAAFDLWGLAKR